MASREVMIEELLEAFTKYEEIIKEFKFGYLKWIDRIKNYNDARRAYSFMFKKLNLCLMELQRVWKLHTPQTWLILRKMNRSCDEVQQLMLMVKDTRTIWATRPKLNKRGGS